MSSTQTESRRGTLYKRPGPPTPSKNGGRLSFGGISVDQLPRTEVLREHNTNNDHATVSKSATKKSTPGKFRSLFSTSKLKDEVRNKLLL